MANNEDSQGPRPTPEEPDSAEQLHDNYRPEPSLNPLQRGLIFLVKVYQWGISPLLGNNCRFYPTCSAYCIQAMEEHGVIKGFWLGLKRVSRCHPFCQGGVDPVPPGKLRKKINDEPGQQNHKSR